MDKVNLLFIEEKGNKIEQFESVVLQFSCTVGDAKN